LEMRWRDYGKVAAEERMRHSNVNLRIRGMSEQSVEMVWTSMEIP